MTQQATDRPLVTFALFAYNQEKYIREAVEGAFSQTYEPLEIILSDDCSSDKTFEIMQEMAAGYDGPHKVSVRQSESNRGLAEHINALVSEAAGEVIVMAAGDDISMPERTSLLMEIFKKYPETAAALSNFEAFPSNDQGKQYRLNRKVTLVEILAAGGGVQKGATYAYRKKCFFWPSRLPDWVISEDRILPLRAALIGDVSYLDKQLVRYRQPMQFDEMLERENRPLWHSHPMHFSYLVETLKQWRIDRDVNWIPYILTRFFLLLVRVAARLKKRTGILARLGVIVFLPIRLVRKVAFEASKFRYGQA